MAETRTAPREEAPGIQRVTLPSRGDGWRRAGLATAKTAFLVALVLGLWVAAIAIWDLNQLTLPSPGSVLEAGRENWSSLVSHSLTTLSESLWAFGISVVLGVAIAAVLARFTLLNSLFFPLVVALQAAPKIAIAPLMIVWLGFGSTVPITVGVLVAVFPMIINTMVGLRGTDGDVLMLAQSMRASEWQVFRRIRIPYALPAILAGMKTALVLSIVGVIVGELTGGQAGLGYLLSVATAQFNMPYAFASLVILVIGSLVLFYLVEGLETRFSWYERDERLKVER